MSRSPAWLVAAPIAHRGLHDRARGIVENSCAAAEAAVAQGFAIECDLQVTGDGEAVVFHDFTLHRLTGRSGRVDETPAQAVCDLTLASGEPVPSLQKLCETVAGRVPIVCEIKSRFRRDPRLADRVAAILADYPGPACIESFDPFVMAYLQAHRQRLRIGHVPLGMVAHARYEDPADEWSHLAPEDRRALAHFLHYPETRPEFLSFGVGDLPHAVPHLCRVGLGLPVTIWTIRSAEERRRARAWGDQIIFEGAPDFARSP